MRHLTGRGPFSKRSGISIRFKSTVSPHANKKLKKLLHLCALSAIKNDKEIQAYFERKIAQGKNKMSVINAVRNKLVHRVFAVIRDDRFYVFEDGLKACGTFIVEAYAATTDQPCAVQKVKDHHGFKDIQLKMPGGAANCYGNIIAHKDQ